MFIVCDMSLGATSTLPPRLDGSACAHSTNWRPYFKCYGTLIDIIPTSRCLLIIVGAAPEPTADRLSTPVQLGRTVDMG
jgi:hypothetical protein